MKKNNGFQKTMRDDRIIEFLEDFKVASTSTIAHKFFSTEDRCRKRLKKLYDNKRVKRVRQDLNHDYVYYLTKPKESKEFMHYFMTTEFYNQLLLRYKVHEFLPPIKLSHIIPDGRFLVEHNGKVYAGLLEVEISKKGFDYNKYLDFYLSKDYKEHFPAMPTVYVVHRYVTNIPKNSPIKFIEIKEDFSDFRLT